MVKITDEQYIKVVKDSLNFVGGFTERDETIKQVIAFSKGTLRLKISTHYDDYIDDWLETDKLYSTTWQKAVVSQSIWDYQNKYGSNLKVNQFESLEMYNRTVDGLILTLQKGVNRLSRQGYLKGGGDDGFK